MPSPGPASIANLPDHRDIQSAGDNGDVRTGRAFFQHHRLQRAAVVIEELRRPQVPRHQDEIISGGDIQNGVIALQQMLEESVGEILQVMNSFSQVRVGDLPHPRVDFVVDLLHRRFRGQPGIDRIADPA